MTDSPELTILIVAQLILLLVLVVLIGRMFTRPERPKLRLMDDSKFEKGDEVVICDSSGEPIGTICRIADVNHRDGTIELEEKKS